MSRVLYLTPRLLYETKMSMGRRLYVESLKDYVDVHVSGPGWPDWPESNDIADWEMRSPFSPDCAIAYKTEDIVGLDQWDCPIACIFNEANCPEKTLADIEATQPTDVFFHHAGDYVQWLNDLARRGIRSHLIHHCAPENPWGQKAFSSRKIDIGVCGVQSREIYPIRHAFAVSGICEVRQHPGYRLPNVEKQYAEYQHWLSSVKVLICCSSRYKYPLAKIHEGLAAGCVVVSDQPNCPFLRGLPYTAFITPADAAALIRFPGHAVDMKDNLLALGELVEKNGNCQQSLGYWRKHFTLDHWAKNFLTAMGIQ